MKKLAKLLLYSGGGLLASAVLGLVIINHSAPTAHAAEIVTDSPAPQWELAALDGARHRLADYRGQVVLLNFWATWCPPCRQEMPELVALQKDLGSKDFTIIGIAMDETDAPVKGYVEKAGLNFPVMMGDAKVAEDYKIRSIPATLVLDREGKVVEQFIGAQPRAKFESAVKEALQKGSKS